MNQKKAKALRRLLSFYGMERTDPRNALRYEMIDTGKKRLNKEGKRLENVYRYQLCNPYKRAFKALVKAVR